MITDKPIWTIDEEGNSTASAENKEFVLEARVILGGNGKWTRYVALSRLGRPKKRGPGRMASTPVVHEMPPQAQTRDEAIKWAESTWKRIVSEAPSVSTIPDSDDASRAS